MFKALQWEDWLGIALGAWLLASPWLLGFSDQNAATMNALVVGTILCLEELLDLGRHEMAEEGIDLVTGAWLVISPFALGFALFTSAAINTIAVGVLTILFAAWAMSSLDEKLGLWWHDHVGSH